MIQLEMPCGPGKGLVQGERGCHGRLLVSFLQ